MRKMKTKVSAMLVALCMLVSLLPAVPVATADALDSEPAEIVIDFGAQLKDATLVNNGWAVNQSKTTGAVNGEDFYTYVLREARAWANNYADYTYKTATNIPFMAAGNTLGLDFTVKKAGYYDIVLYVTDNSAPSTYGVTVNEKYIGQAETSAIGAINQKVEIGNTYLNAGTNLIQFTYVANRDCFYPNALVFTETDAPAATIKLNFADAEVNWKYSAAYTSSALYSVLGSANYGEDTGSKLKYNLENDWDLGIEFTVEKAGWYTLASDIAHIFSWGHEVNSIYVITPGNVNPELMKKSFVGEFTAQDTSGVWNGTEVVYLNAGKNILYIESNVDSGRNYFNLSHMTFTETDEVPAFSQTLVFGKKSFLPGATSTELTDATIDENGWALNTELTTVDASYYGGDAFRNDVLYVNYGDDLNVQMAYDFYVPVAGIYDLNAVMWEMTEFGGIYDFSVGKDDEFTDIGRVFNDPNVGADATITVVTKGLKSAYLDEGVNTLIVRAADRDRIVNGRLYTGLLSFTMTEATGNEADEVVITAPDTIILGESADVSAKVVDASGNEITADGDFSFVCWPTATCANTYNASYENGKVTGTGLGETYLYATAIVNGEKYAARKLITVVEEPKVKITNAEIFGDVSAYITKTEEGNFKFTALSAINDTAYTEVGFYIDGVKYAVAGGNVYKSVNVNGTATAVAEFFTESTPAGANDPYIFFSSKDFSAKPGSVEFKPYAVPVNGAEIVGHTYTVSLS